MLPREILPGTTVLVDEDAAWRELLLGVRPTLPSDPDEMITVWPGSSALCLVKDLAVAPVAVNDQSASKTAPHL